MVRRVRPATADARLMHRIERAEPMMRLYKQGKTLEQIGTRFGLTRERVRQILSRVDPNYTRHRPHPLPTLPLGKPRKIDTFWQHVSKAGPDECWEWSAARTGCGYGHVTEAGRHFSAHRIAYEKVNGPIPEGMCVLHRCDNPPCCNPDHLFLGTQLDNMRDRDAKGRGRCGQSSAIRERDDAICQCYADGDSVKQISERFGVSGPNVYAICYKRLVRRVAPIRAA